MKIAASCVWRKNGHVAVGQGHDWRPATNAILQRPGHAEHYAWALQTVSAEAREAAEHTKQGQSQRTSISRTTSSSLSTEAAGASGSSIYTRLPDRWAGT